MNAASTHGPPDGRHVLEALPVGIALYDPDRRLLLVNAAFGRIIGLSPGVFRPLSTLIDNVRLVAYRGIFGPGDPEVQTRQIAVDDIGKARRFERRHPDGRSFDAHHIPLADGGHLICLVDTSSALTQTRDSAEQALARVTAAVATLPLGLALLTPGHTLEHHTPRFAGLLGLPPAALAGSTAFETLRATIAARDGAFASPGLLAAPATIRHTRKDGAVLDIAGAPLPGGGWSLAVTDVSALAAAESEVARRTQLTADIVANIPHGISVYGPDRRLLLVNDAYNRIMAGAPIQVGESVDQIIDRRARSGEYGPGDPAELAHAQRAHDNTRPQLRRRRRPDGNVVDIRTAPLPGGSHISVVTDVTALIAAETELARRTETLEPLLANIRHGVIVWDKDNRLLAANPLAAILLGTPEALLAPGRTLADVIGGELDRGNFGDGPAAAARAKALIEQDRTIPQRTQRSTRAGRMLDVCSNPAPAGGFVTTFTDITELQETEEALRLSRAAADAAVAAKSRFLATVGAELRTSLTAILAETAALSREAAPPPAKPPAPARIAAACDTVGAAASALLALLDTALDAACLEAEHFGLADDHVDLPALLRSVLRRFDAQATAAEVALVLEMPAPVPPVRADRRRLLQAVSAVLSNAIEITRPLGSISIGARHDWARGSVLLEINDTGPGIPPADIERAFEPFTQLDQPRAARTGTGLGLYTGRLIMRAHGGDLTLRSLPGLGTTATLLIPATRVLPDPPPK